MNENIIETDVCILGTGIAGLSAALECAKNNVSVTIITKSDIKESSTLYAQGGIAVAMHQDDTPQLHLEDTLKAGAGHCIPDMVKCLVEEGPKHVSELIQYGANFDKQNNELDYTKEGAHSKRRILHAGDATGKEIEKTLGNQLLNYPSVQFFLIIRLHPYFITEIAVAESTQCLTKGQHL